MNIQGNLYTHASGAWYTVAAQYTESLKVMRLYQGQESWITLTDTKMQNFIQSIKDNTLQLKNGGHFSQFKTIQ